LLKNLIKLLVSLSLISNLSHAETTNNLVSQDFTTGWSGTNLNSLHGSTTIAGVNNSYIESDAVSLNSQDINKESLNEGFTVTGGADIWFWNNATQSVTQTIKTVDDNNNTLTQTRVISGSCSTTNSCSFGSYTDQLIIGSNSQQDYDVSLRFAFSESTNSTSHWAADLKNPTLSVTYTYVAPLDTATQTALLDLNNIIKEDLKDVQSVEIKEEEVTLKTDTFQTEKFESAELTTTSTDTMSTDNTKDLTSAEPPKETQSYQDSSSTDSSAEATPATTETSSDTSSQESQTQDQASSDSTDDKQEATSESSSSQDVADKGDKSSGDSKTSSSISLGESINNIDVQVKDPGKNLELKNLVMLDKMIDNSALQEYANVEFYKTKDIYTDQADIRDNRILYSNASLVSYMQKDPVFIKQNEIYNIRLQKQKLIRELQVLKNG
jgi:hypothetical protein